MLIAITGFHGFFFFTSCRFSEKIIKMPFLVELCGLVCLEISLIFIFSLRCIVRNKVFIRSSI